MDFLILFGLIGKLAWILDYLIKVNEIFVKYFNKSRGGRIKNYDVNRNETGMEMKLVPLQAKE